MSDTMQVDEQAEAEAEAEGVKRGRGSVTYFGKGLDSVPLDELPEEAPVKRGANKTYRTILEAIADDADRVGKWNPIAEFQTNGAKAIANALNKQVRGEVWDGTGEKPRGYLTEEQTRDIPEYDGFEWQFDSRRTEEGSVLYAKLVESE